MKYGLKNIKNINKNMLNRKTTTIISKKIKSPNNITRNTYRKIGLYSLFT
jgi:hypothetical protein